MQVLKYLARYTHRVAISNRPLLSMENGRVRFAYKDYADGNQSKVMTLDATEFIRRFLLHILPRGFVRIRQFGFLANRARGKKLALCRILLGVSAPAKTAATDHGKEIEEQDDRRCPACKIESVWSPVNKTSMWSSSATRRSSPFLSPAQP